MFTIQSSKNPVSYETSPIVCKRRHRSFTLFSSLDSLTASFERESCCLGLARQSPTSQSKNLETRGFATSRFLSARGETQPKFSRTNGGLGGPRISSPEVPNGADPYCVNWHISYITLELVSSLCVLSS